MIEDHTSVAIAMTAHIDRTNGDKNIFEAILILKFDDEHKITLWHEVYIQLD